QRADELDDVRRREVLERGGQVHEGAGPGDAEPPALAQPLPEEARDLAGDRGTDRLAGAGGGDGDGGDPELLGEAGQVASGGGGVDDLDAHDPLMTSLIEEAGDLETGEVVTAGELDLGQAVEIVLGGEGDLQRDLVGGGRAAADLLVRACGRFAAAHRASLRDALADLICGRRVAHLRIYAYSRPQLRDDPAHLSERRSAVVSALRDDAPCDERPSPRCSQENSAWAAILPGPRSSPPPPRHPPRPPPGGAVGPCPAQASPGSAPRPSPAAAAPAPPRASRSSSRSCRTRRCRTRSASSTTSPRSTPTSTCASCPCRRTRRARRSPPRSPPAAASSTS